MNIACSHSLCGYGMIAGPFGEVKHPAGSTRALNELVVLCVYVMPGLKSGLFHSN